MMELIIMFLPSLLRQWSTTKMGEVQSHQPVPPTDDPIPTHPTVDSKPMRIELTLLPPPPPPAPPLPPTTAKQRRQQQIAYASYRVGATSILGRYLHNQWPYYGIQDSRRTSRMDTYNHTCVLDDVPIRCTLRDVDGYCKLLRTNIQRRTGYTDYDAVGIMFVYDISNKASWKATKEQMVEALEWKLHDDIAVYMLLGNKADKEEEREVEYLEAKGFADEYGVLLFEVSARDGKNVEFAFVSFIAQLIQYQHAESNT